LSPEKKTPDPSFAGDGRNSSKGEISGRSKTVLKKNTEKSIRASVWANLLDSKPQLGEGE